MMLRKVTSAAVVMAAAAALVGCSNDEVSRFDPRSLGAGERYAATDRQPEALRPLPTTLRSQFLPDQRDDPSVPREDPAREPLADEERIVRLPLREIAQRAVLHNLAVRVSGYSPAIEETRITEAESRYDPDFFAGATFQANRQPRTNFFGDNSDQLQFELGVRQNLPAGGQVELAYRPVRFNLADGAQQGPAGINDDNTFWNSQIQLTLTQPLLRDFGTDINNARIVINRNNQRISVLEFRKDLEQMLLNLEETYWRLKQAEENVRIQENLLQRTLDTADIVSKRINQDVTLEQISTSVSRVESSRNDLIRARQQVKDLSDQLKNLMNDPDFPIAGGVLILASSEPLTSPVAFDFPDAVSTGLLNRYELGQQQFRVDSATVAMRVAKNNELPQLNLVGSIGTQAIGEDAFDAAGDNFSGFGADNGLSYSIGLQFVQKIGNREARAIFRRAQLQRQQAIDQYRQIIDQVSFDIRRAIREVETSWQVIGQSRKARLAAAKALETIQTIETQGGEPLTPNFIERKLSRQQELAAAERAEADAVSGYNIAISRFESAKGTLLRYNNVVMDERKR